MLAIRANSPEEEEGDCQAISRLWSEALKDYKGVVGHDLTHGFTCTKDMIDQATNDMENFHKFRHNEKKVDRLRTILAENFGYIEAGTKQLANAASSAFPPAAAIGAALTYFMGACRLVSADYDTITVFFEDMKSFLQRIMILETRLPNSKHYRVCLTDVFASFLLMCGFAQRFVELGRFRKWVTNLINGEDSELASARKDMDLKLSRLQNATENAILGNTEEQLKMARELERNAKCHTEVLHEQLETMKSIRDTTERMSEDIAKLIKTINQQGNKNETNGLSDLAHRDIPLTAMRIRNMLPAVRDEGLEYRILKETLLDDTCTWVFSEPQWREWSRRKDNGPMILAITGPAGLGKSHISAAIYQSLQKEAQADSTKQTCVCQFHFREHKPDLSSLLPAVANLINQIAGQSSSLCELFNTQWQNDEIQIDVSSWQHLVQFLLVPAFNKESKNILIVVLDGIDELQSLSDFEEFMQILRKEEINISVVLTSRTGTLSSTEEAGFLTLEATIEKQTQDLKTLIWARLNSLGSLRTFSRYVQQRIADRVETTAPSMLYAEHILHRLDDLGRQGAVLRAIGQPLPSDLHAIYESMLRDCYRRTDAGYHTVVNKLLYWVAFAFRPLILNEVASLAKVWSNYADFDLEDIPEPFAKFIRVGDPGADAEERASLQAREAWGAAITELEVNKDDDQPDAIFDDGKLLVKFRERSLRSFFRETPQSGSLHRWTPSQACCQIFLDCVSILRSTSQEAAGAIESVKSFAVEHLMKYWIGIKLKDRSIEEQVKVMEAMGTIMTDRHQYPALIELQKDYYTTRFTEKFFLNLSQWAALLETVQHRLSKDSFQWWGEAVKSPANCLWHIAKAHAERIFNATDAAHAKTAFTAFVGCFRASQHNPACITYEAESPLGDREIILCLQVLFEDICVSACSYRAIASLLLNCDDRASAQKMCQKAIDIAEVMEERLKASELMATICMKTDVEAAYNNIISSLGYIAESSAVSLDLERRLLITKARIEVLMENQDEAANSFAKARTIDPTALTTGDILSEEINIFGEDNDKWRVINTLMTWRPLERLAWITWKFNKDEAEERSLLLIEAAVHTGKHDLIIGIYKEAIEYLDNVQAGAPLRIDLGFFYLEVCDDAQKAKDVTDEILDSRYSKLRYPVTRASPNYILELAIELQSQANNILFRDSDDPAIMSELLNAQEGLLERPLALDVPPTSETFLFQMDLTLSRMYAKMGPAVKFQTKLQAMIDKCIERLRDKVGWNDADSLAQLATALSDLSIVVKHGEELKRVATILVSAQFSVLTVTEDEAAKYVEGKIAAGQDTQSESSEEGLGDPADVERQCVGPCKPNTTFSRWGTSVGYQCLTCYFCFLCEECYGKLDDLSNELKERKYPKYCEKQFGHIKAPIEGWRGVKNGKVMIEGEEPVSFTQLLDNIQGDLCKEAWKDFWRH
ncbi:hypothetical protein FGRMN_4804 [Fusarium graminum]|nr:hypothetical protein FGRMN_4804 [Fusarium graminum]